MENKYFTPDIEDIRVGYECEYMSPSLGWIKLIVADYHFKTNIPEGYNGISIFNISEYLKQENWIRVPYLTKEQIEAEGWKPVDLKGFAYRYGVPSFRHGFTKGNFIAVLDTRKYHIEISAADVTLIDFLPEFPEMFRVTIPCKDINTFRYICKLLGI